MEKRYQPTVAVLERVPAVDRVLDAAAEAPLGPVAAAVMATEILLVMLAVVLHQITYQERQAQRELLDLVVAINPVAQAVQFRFTIV